MGNPNYASKGVAGTGLGLGIAGTALGLLQNGGLGGLFGNSNAVNNANQDYISKLQSEVSQLKAEKYSDKNAKEVYMQSLNDNRRLRDEINAFIKPISEEVANNRVELATLKAEQNCCCEKQELREQILVGKINEVALTTTGRFNALDQTISCLQGDVNRNTRRLNQITQEIVPIDKVCPEPMLKYNSWEAPNVPA